MVLLMSNLDLENIKKQFENVQKQQQKFNEEKIRLETEIKNLSAESDKLLQELFAISNTNSLEELELYQQRMQQQLTTEKNNLENELQTFLNNYNNYNE